eukprot:15058065-Ditylum_brightwellii.AAC.1
MEDCDKDEKVAAMIHTVHGSFVPNSNGEYGNDLKPEARDMLQSHSAAGFNDDVDSIEDLDDCDKDEKVEAIIHTER